MSQVSLLFQQEFSCPRGDNSTYFSFLDKMYISTSGQLLAIIGNNNYVITTLYNTSAKEIINITITHKISDISFVIDDSAIIYSAVIGVVRYFIGNQTEEVLLPFSKFNKISDIEVTPDGRTLLMLNQSSKSNSSVANGTANSISSLVSLDLTNLEITSIVSTNSCNASILSIHRQSQVLLTSSANCIICKWKWQGGFQLLKLNNLKDAICKAKSLSFVGSSLVIAKGFNLNKKIRSSLLNVQTLQIQGNTSHSTYQNEGTATAARNNLISYGSNDMYIWVYPSMNFSNQTLNLSNPRRFSFDNRYVNNVEYNSVKDEVYISVLTSNLSQKDIRTYHLMFQCAYGGSTVKDSSIFLESCPCSAGEMFDKLNAQCVKKECGAEGCMCPVGQRWTNYGLKCELECGTIRHSSVSTAFGNPAQCYCQLPYAWNPLFNDCSYYDCPFLPQGTGSAGQTCSCKQGFSWNIETKNCYKTQNPTPNTPIDLPSPNSPIGPIIGVILILILLVVGVWIYYKKCRKNSPQNEQNADQQEPKPSERGLTVKETIPQQQLIYDLQSNEQLDAKDYRSEKSDTQSQKTSAQPDLPPNDIDLHNFSICDDPQNDALSQKFSQLESHMQRPLQ